MTPQHSETDLVVVGGGPGGYVAAIRAAQRGIDATLVERDAPGGVCLNHGCIPSKATLDVAKRVHGIRRLPGVTADPDVDVAEVAAWRASVVDRLTSGVGTLCEANGVTHLPGTARFVDATTVAVDPPDLTGDETRVSFEHAVVATGSRPVELPGFAFDDGPVLNSRQALALDAVPDRLVVVGAGYIGLELSTAFARLGADVTVVEALDAALPGYDADLVAPVRAAAESAGIDFHFGERAEEWYEDVAGDVVVATEGADGDRSEYPADAVLVAVGREPVTDTANLPAVGVEPDADGFIPTDDVGRTATEHVYAIGDVAGEPMLAHEASHEGERAVAAVAGETPPPASASPRVVYTDPEIATVGLTRSAAEDSDRAVAVGEMPLAANGRALAAGGSEGFVRVVADADTGVVLGAELVGPHVSELVGELSLAVTAGLDVRQVAATVHAHPTLGEAVMEAAAAVDGDALHTTSRDRTA